MRILEEELVSNTALIRKEANDIHKNTYKLRRGEPERKPLTKTRKIIIFVLLGLALCLIIAAIIVSVVAK